MHVSVDWYFFQCGAKSDSKKKLKINQNLIRKKKKLLKYIIISIPDTRSNIIYRLF